MGYNRLRSLTAMGYDNFDCIYFRYRGFTFYILHLARIRDSEDLDAPLRRSDSEPFVKYILGVILLLQL